MQSPETSALNTGGAASAVIRKAHLADMAAVKLLIDDAAGDDAVLPRTLIELCENVRDFHLYEHDGQIVGCSALHVDMQNLAEVRSLVVREGRRGSGIGSALVRACLDEARGLGVEKVYALTRSPRFFEREGFTIIDKHDLPSKVFRDCVRCPKFPDCDETAVSYTITTG